MINARQIKSGRVINLGEKFYEVISSSHVKPGKGPAYMRMKLKSMKDQAIIEKTFRSEEKLKLGFIEQKKLIFLYNDDKTYFFMDGNSYEQISVTIDRVVNLKGLVKEGQLVCARTCEAKIIGIELPNFISLKVVSTEGGTKGDTVKAANKNVQLETGMTLSVPLFIREGDLIKIDTRSRKYIGRV